MNKIFLMALAFFLSACNGDNEILDAAHVEISAEAEGSEEVGEASKIFRRAEGQRIELEAGLVNIVPLALEPCATASARHWMYAALFASVAAMLPAAQAHGSHAITAPPGVFDAVGQADGAEQSLGSLSVADGSYCALRIAILPVVAGGDLVGKSAAIGPCYYPDSAGLPAGAATASAHECWLSTLTAGEQDVRLYFASPLVVNGADAEYHSHLRVNYRHWFDGLDMEALRQGETVALAALLRNVAANVTVTAVAH